MRKPKAQLPAAAVCAMSAKTSTKLCPAGEAIATCMAFDTMVVSNSSRT